MTAAGGSDDLAIRLYEWNADLCGAFTEVMHHAEVVFRNRIHQHLDHSYPPAPDPWYKQALLEPKGVESVDEAERRIRQRGHAVTSGRVVAALPFGFWNGLFGHGYEALWRQSLHGAFRQHGPSRRKDVAAVTERVRLFGNRVAHHERLFSHNLRAAHDDLLKLAMWVDPGARDWILAESRVVQLLNARPQ